MRRSWNAGKGLRRTLKGSLFMPYTLVGKKSVKKVSAASSYMKVLYFPPSHARCPCSFGASRDDLHPRTGCLPPLTRSGEERWRITTGNRNPFKIYIYVCLTRLLPLRNTSLFYNRFILSYCNRKLSPTPSPGSSQPNRHHAHSHRSCLDLSRMFARNIKELHSS